MRKEMFVAVVLENGPKGPRLAASPSSEDVETVMSLLIGPIKSPVELINQKGKERSHVVFVSPRGGARLPRHVIAIGSKVFCSM